MHDADFWTQCAEAMELQIEGRRLIAAEIADLARQLWRDAANRLDAMIHTGHRGRRLPPA